jgi:hypothetical protein
MCNFSREQAPQMRAGVVLAFITIVSPGKRALLLAFLRAVVSRSNKSTADTHTHTHTPRERASTMHAPLSPSLRVPGADVVFNKPPEPVDTTPRDKDGYPLTARRKLKKVEGGQFQDIETGQRFKARKGQDGTRLLPVFPGRVTWKTKEGYEAAKLILSCMGAEGEYKLWSKEKDAEMTQSEWLQMGVKNVSKPPIKHTECGQVVETSALNDLQKGNMIGCRCHYPHAEENMWKNRYGDAVEMAKKGRFVVVTSQEDWKRDCTNKDYCPTFKCMECGDTTTKTSLSNMQQSGRIGCGCCHNTSAEQNMWKNRYGDAVQMGKEGRFVVVTSQEDWTQECNGKDYCPTLKCLDCNQLVETTPLTSLQQGRGLGCGCRNKTEAKVADWIRNRLPEAIVKSGFPGPGKGPGATHFDIHLRFPDGFEVIVEVDGAQHFWRDHRFFTLEGCKRDLQKEEWSVDAQRNISIIRLIQEDAWFDRNGWDTFLMHSIDAARKAERARVFHPDAREYTSENSAYVQLRE